MNKTHYRTCTVDGVEIFYREAGSPDDPGVLLLHGWPSSSRMFEKLIPTLSDRYVIAPDYPAFGEGRFGDAAAYWQETLELAPGLASRPRQRGHPTWASIENIIR